MSDRIFADIMTIAVGVIGLAIIATLVGKNAQTGNVIKQAGTSFSDVLKAAVGPVS